MMRVMDTHTRDGRGSLLAKVCTQGVESRVAGSSRSRLPKTDLHKHVCTSDSQDIIKGYYNKTRKETKEGGVTKYYINTDDERTKWCGFIAELVEVA